MSKKRPNLRAPLFSSLLAATLVHFANGQTESVHSKGPDGLEAWTLLYPVEGHGQLPMELVIARDKKILRKIPGEGFVWKWIFLEDGKKVAFESGPLHFSLDCVLIDVPSGHELARVDCFSSPLLDSVPEWVRILETSPDPGAPNGSHSQPDTKK